MRVLFTSTNGAGHLNPLLPYAREMAARGHDIRIACRVDLAEQIAKAGFPHVVLEEPRQEELEAIWKRAGSLGASEALKVYVEEIFGGLMIEYALPGVLAEVKDWQPQLIVRESAEGAAHFASQTFGIPCMRVEVHNGQSEEDLLYANFREPFARWQNHCGLPVGDLTHLHDEPVFCGFPAALDGDVFRHSRSPVRVFDRQRPESVDPAVWGKEEGKPFVYLTFGTVAHRMDAARYIFRAALDAVAGLEVKALLTTGVALSEDVLGPVAENVAVRRYVPQDQVLPHADAMISHGGSGTMVGGFAAGVPQVITPLFADQPSNAELLQKAGLGRAVMDQTPEKIRAALEDVLQCRPTRKAADDVAAEMAAMMPVAQAVDLMLAEARAS